MIGVLADVCSVKYLFRAHRTKLKEKRKEEKSIIQKVFYGHRLTQINADENHKLLIDFGRSALLCDGKTSYLRKPKKINQCKSMSEMCCYSKSKMQHIDICEGIYKSEL